MAKKIGWLSKLSLMNYCDRNNDVAIGITNIHVAANLLSRTEIPPIKKKKKNWNTFE